MLSICVCAALQDIADRFEGQHVLVVSHGEVRIWVLQLGVALIL